MTHQTTLHRLGWIKRRARRIQRFYNVSRKLAVYDARIDYLSFIGWQTGCAQRQS